MYDACTKHVSFAHSTSACVSPCAFNRNKAEAFETGAESVNVCLSSEVDFVRTFNGALNSSFTYGTVMKYAQ